MCVLLESILCVSSVLEFLAILFLEFLLLLSLLSHRNYHIYSLDHIFYVCYLLCRVFNLLCLCVSFQIVASEQSFDSLILVLTNLLLPPLSVS